MGDPNGPPDNDLRPDASNSNSAEDTMEEDLIHEDDLIEVGDVQNGGQEDDFANEMDMLDMDEDDDDEELDEDGASSMVVTPDHDDAVIVFSKHSGSVFCVDVSRDLGQFAVTGGEDDRAYVWNINSGEVLFECTGHKDSVTCVSFSQSCVFVATGDLGGCVQVWSVQEKKVIWSFEVSDLEWLTWHQSAPVLLAGTVDGDIWMWKIPSGDTKTFQSFGCPCNLGKIMPDGKRAIAGYEDGTIRVWDLKSATPIHTFTGHSGHTKSITSLSCHSDNNLVLTGSTDCTSLLLNMTTGKVISRFQCRKSASAEEEDSVETVGLSNVLPYAATGTLTGSLDIWDIPTQICRQHCQHEAGVVKLYWDETQPLVYTCSLDGKIQLWDSRSGKREKLWIGHEASILDLQIHTNGNKLVTTSDDQTARVFSVT